MIGLLRKSMRTFSSTVFDKILDKSIPSQPVYEDEHIYAFRDINPQAPVHILIIPKIKDGLSGISQAKASHQAILGHMMVSVPKIASKVGLTNGYRLVVNEGKEGCQEVAHLHIHLLGGRQMRWPPGQEYQIQSTMNQSQNNPSPKSSFHRRRQHELAKLLIDQMGIDPELTHLLLANHKPSTRKEAFDLFLVDEEGFANHFFFAHPDTGIDACRLCDKRASEHISTVSAQVMKAQQEELHRSELSLSDLEQQVGAAKITCQICYTEVIEVDMLQFAGQTHNLCLQCIEHYLKEEIGSMRVEHLTCPHCNVALPQALIKELVDVPTYNKYRKFLRNIEIQKNPKLRWCPNSKCSVVISTNPKKKTSKCPKCATIICNRCNREAHPKSSCEGAFRKEIKTWQNASDIQKCKKCHGLVQKIAGCNHMTCSVCHYQWCWLCGSEYSSTHFSPLNPFGCPGLQDRARDQWGKCRIFLLRLGILLLLIIGFPVVLPVAMLAVGPVVIIQMLREHFHPEECLAKVSMVMGGLLVGLLANPIAWVVCVVYFIPKGISKVCEWYRERRQQQLRINNLLQERLLNEQIYQQPALE